MKKVIIALVILGALIGGYFLWKKKKKASTGNAEAVTTADETDKTITIEGVDSETGETILGGGVEQQDEIVKQAPLLPTEEKAAPMQVKRMA